MWNLLKRLAAEDNVITFLWIRHVPARGASVFDGYSALQVPEARTAGTDVDWSRFAGIHEDHACRVSSR